MPSSPPPAQSSAAQGEPLKNGDPEWETRFDGLEGLVDVMTFDQLLELDEPDDREFSASVIEGYFEQAGETFQQLQKAIEDENYQQITELGHFLKGSSATVGFIKVKGHCEQLEQAGKMAVKADSASAKQQYMTTIKAELDSAEKSCGALKPLIRTRFYGYKSSD